MAETKLSRGLYINNQQILVCPTAEQIRRINKIPNVEYFTTLGNDPEIANQDSVYDPYEVFRIRIVTPLAQRLANDEIIRLHPAEDIGIRGSACSLVGELRYHRRTQMLQVRSLEQILQEGTDSGEIKTGLVPVDDLEGFPSMYLRYYPRSFRTYAGIYSGKGNMEFPIFPLLLVYDKSKLTLDPRTYQYIVPTEKERISPIIRAFVLDYHTGPS